MNARDRGCRVPGCTNTRCVDGHHVEHWADGGESSIEPDACIGKWHAGERMDWQMAVSAMFQR